MADNQPSPGDYEKTADTGYQIADAASDVYSFLQTDGLQEGVEALGPGLAMLGIPGAALIGEGAPAALAVGGDAALVGLALGGGIAVGAGLDYVTGGALSDGVADAIGAGTNDPNVDLEVAREFDDGNYLDAAGTYLGGVADHIESGIASLGSGEPGDGSPDYGSQPFGDGDGEY
jgi:hypothetical protein